MNTPDYPRRLDRLETLRAAPVLQGRWPAGTQPLPLEAALNACGEADRAAGLARNVATTRAQLAMLGRPIIAVLGQLNAGKSSVVASFLSAEGQRRVPRGEEEDKGTHRFVYWVPASWLADQPSRESFFGLLDAVHGRQRELLADDPDTAAAQYRSGRDAPAKLQIPLIAGDEALDAIGAALLDCPDVQTHDAGSAPAAVENRRLELLVHAAQLCSAFLVVWRRASVREGLLKRMLADVRQRLDTAPLFLLLNHLEPEPDQPTKTRNDRDVVELLERFAIADDAVFAAFHWKIEPGWREFTPPALVESFTAAAERLPQFFQIAADAAANRPESVAPGRFLTRLPARLDLADLQRRKMADAWSDLGRFTRECIAALREHQRAQQRQAAEMHAGLLAMCVEEMTDAATGEARQVLSREFAEAFEASLRRTARGFVRFTMHLARPVHAVVKAVSNLASEARLWWKLRDDIKSGKIPWEDAKRKYRETFARQFADQQVVFSEGERLAARMKAQRWVPADTPEPKLAEGWLATFKNFHRYPPTIDSAELDRMTAEIWGALQFWDKMKFATKNLLAAVGGLVAAAGTLVAAFDLGATAFATISFTAWIAAILPGKLMAAAAVAGGATLGASLLISSMKVNTLPYLARLFAFAADAFGVPRTVSPGPIRVTFGPRHNPQQHELPEPGVPLQETICRLAELRLWDETPALEEVEQLFTP